MTLREIIVRAMEIVGSVDIATDNADGNRLVSSARFICAECADRYADLVKTEEVFSTTGRILFSSLEKPIKRVFSVKKNDLAAKYQEDNEGITVDAPGRYVIEYGYFSTRKELDEEVEMPKNFGLDTLAYGTAAEYFFRAGFSDEAILYKNRYDNAVKNDLRKMRSGRLPFRGFV